MVLRDGQRYQIGSFCFKVRFSFNSTLGWRYSVKDLNSELLIEIPHSADLSLAKLLD